MYVYESEEHYKAANQVGIRIVKVRFQLNYQCYSLPLVLDISCVFIMLCLKSCYNNYYGLLTFLRGYEKRL